MLDFIDRRRDTK